MEFRTRSKSNYLLDAEWHELHALTSHWKSDMIFFGDELHFIDLLFDKYFTSLVDPDHLETTKTVATRVSDIKKTCDALYQKVLMHLQHIENLMVNPFSLNAAAFREEHATLEDELVAFIKNFKEVKRVLFELAERVVKTEKEKHLIG
jgi:hypothetical protein